MNYQKVIKKLQEDIKNLKFVSQPSDPQWQTITIGGYGAEEKSTDLLNEYIGWTYANIVAISEAVAEIKIQLFELKSGDQVDEVKEHPILELLHRPNEYMTKREFIQLLTIYRLLTGESPIRLKGTTPSELHPLDPLTINPIIGKTADGFEMTVKYEMTENFNGVYTKKTLKPEEIIFIKNMNPRNKWRGFGVVEAAQNSINTLQYSELYNLNFFKNSAVPFTVLYTDQKLNDSVISRLKNSWDTNYKGVNNSFKTAILEAGLKVERLQSSSKDMDFIEQQRFLRDKLMAMFKTTKVALGITEDVNRCFSDDHEVLTNDGWKTVYELSKNDEVATWNQEKMVMEYQKPTDIPKYEYDGELIEYKNNRVDIAVTPNHRMLYQKMNDKSEDGLGSWDTKEAQEIEDRAVTVFRTTGKYGNNHNGGLLKIPKIEYGATGKKGNEPYYDHYLIEQEQLAEFVGFYAAEGWTAKCLVAVAQNTNSEKYDYIKNLLKELPFGDWKENQRKSLSRGVDTGNITSTFSNSNKTLAYWLKEQVNSGCENKKIPQFIFNGSDKVKQSFIKGLVAGDGYRYSEKTFAIRTKSEQLVNDLQRLGIELGIATSVNRSNGIPLVIFSEREKIWVKRESIKRIQYNGLVWCVTVPNSYIFIRRNGQIVVTGNSNAEASEYVFMKNCIRPKMAQLIESMNEFLLPIYDPEGKYFLDFEDPVPKDRATLINEYTAAHNKWLTTNEIRNLEGYEDVEGGDEIWQAIALTTMSNPTPNTPEIQTTPKPTEQQEGEQPEGEQPEQAVGELPEGQEPTPAESRSLGYRVLKSKHKIKTRDFSEQVAKLKNRNVRIKQIKEDLKKQIRKILKSKVKTKVVKKYEPKYKNMKTKSDTDLFIKSILANSDRFEKKMNDVMKWKYYQPQMQTIINKLKKKGTKFMLPKSKSIQKQIGDDFMFSQERYVGVGIDLLTPLLKEILITQGVEAMLTLNVDTSYSLLDAARKYLNTKPTKLAKSITETAYTRVRESLAEGIKDGESIKELSDRVIEQYTSLEVYQAENIARTEVSRATNFATTDAFKQSGVIEGKEWVVTPDDRLCEFCQSMESEYNSKAGLDDDYFKIGDIVNGTEGGRMTVDFDDVNGPPLHNNCRCVLKSVEKLITKKAKPKVKKEAKPKEDLLLKEIEDELDVIKRGKTKEPKEQTAGKKKQS